MSGCGRVVMSDMWEGEVMSGCGRGEMSDVGGRVRYVMSDNVGWVR